MRQIKIRDKAVGDSQPAYVIAEMAWSHDGSLEKAKEIIKGTADAGGNAISVHITSLKDYMVRNYGSTAGQTVSAGKEQEVIFNYLDRVNMKDDDWKELFPYAKSLGIAVCAMPNDLQSLKLCAQLQPDAYVLAASCFVEEDMVTEVARQKKPVILRIGGATLGEIETTINRIREQGNEEIMLLHGFQSYPTKIENTRLRLISSFKSIFGLPVGLAEHIDGDSPLAMIVPLVAIGFGANLIEKHLTHDRSLKGEDFESALNPPELKKLVADIREVEKALGPSAFGPLPEEVRYRKVSRKRTVALRAVKKGAKITREDFGFKRADDGIAPDESRYLIGRTAGTDIKEDAPITWDKVL